MNSTFMTEPSSDASIPQLSRHHGYEVRLCMIRFPPLADGYIPRKWLIAARGETWFKERFIKSLPRALQ